MSEVSRHKYFKQKANTYLAELDANFMFEAGTELDSNEADEIRKNVADILHGLDNCMNELVKENLAGNYKPEIDDIPEL